MKNLSEQIDDKYAKDKIMQEKADKEYLQKSMEIENLIITSFKEVVKIVGYRLQMNKTHEQMYNFSFNMSANDKMFSNKITSYIHTNNLFNVSWEFNKNTYTFFRSTEIININNLKNELIKWIEDLIQQTEILKEK